MPKTLFPPAPKRKPTEDPVLQTIRLIRQTGFTAGPEAAEFAVSAGKEPGDVIVTHRGRMFDLFPDVFDTYMRDAPVSGPADDDRTRENARRGILRALWQADCADDETSPWMCVTGDVDPPAEYDPLGADEPAPRPRWADQPTLLLQE
ncbi:hypothetical protein [Alienimonas californiensis]|uniref:Uncharacterized protein n=1 Tax=Alienimonas californiensis TaxID=2527989 RepID=A0A517PB06_9PLAN|nr:hypothetical protein [Alienimonas californiensis]QDT16544.1 hypothetical protein CA12_26500 [Alienimonas californiensis]